MSQRVAMHVPVPPGLLDDEHQVLALVEQSRRQLVQRAAGQGLRLTGDLHLTLADTHPLWDEVPQRWWQRLLQRPVQRTPRWDGPRHTLLIESPAEPLPRPAPDTSWATTEPGGLR